MPADHLTDVSLSAWYHEAVDYVVENNVMQGTSVTTFEPATNLNRAMMVQILYNLEEKPVVDASSFNDVASDAWYADAISWAGSTGIVNGYGDDLFGPDDNITREQMSLMLFNYCKYKGVELPVIHPANSFADAEQISSWAADAVNTMYQAGILNGKGSNTFDPQGEATRAEVAQMLMNFMKTVL